MKLPRLGLRGRLVAALFVTAVVTLAVAALTLLSPLERKLRDNEVRSLAGAAVAARPTFDELPERAIRPGSHLLARVAAELGRRTQARVAIFDERGARLVDTDRDDPETFADVLPALQSDRPLRRIVSAGAEGDARVAARFESGGDRYVVTLRKRLGDVRLAVDAVETAVSRAAAVALAAAILIGLALATAILRRLRRLRDATLELGSPAALPGPPPARGRDEVDDLAHAFEAMRARIERQEELRRAFVATASHELRTPLTSLSGMLELLAEDLAGEPPDLQDARRQVAGAREQSDRMTRLAADLLDLSRLDAHLELRREPVEVGELSRAVIAELDARARARGSSIVLDSPAPCWALGDPSAAARILRILLDNALRYTPAGAPIQVGIAHADGVARVDVSDSGPGVAEPDRDRIFERFTRGRDATQEGGFGLGLAIGRELAERMDGSLTLQAGDNGATFALTLPAAHDRAS